MTDHKTVIKGIIAQFKDNLKDLKRGVEMGKGCITSTPYIVMVGDLCIDPEIKDRKTTRKFSYGLPCRVRRFSKNDASSIAETVKNGNGESGVAVGWVDATKERIESIQAHIAMMEASLV